MERMGSDGVRGVPMGVVVCVIRHWCANFLRLCVVRLYHDVFYVGLVCCDHVV